MAVTQSPGHAHFLLEGNLYSDPLIIRTIISSAKWYSPNKILPGQLGLGLQEVIVLCHPIGAYFCTTKF